MSAGAAAFINYYFFDPELENSPEKLASRRHNFSRAADGSSQVSSRGEAGKMPIGNGIESRMAADEQRILQRTLHSGGGPGGVAESRLRAGDKVESRTKLESVQGTIPALTKGTVTEVTAEVVTIDLGRFGVQAVNAGIAAKTFAVLPGYSQQQSIKESFGLKPSGSLVVGDRVKDSRGVQYAVLQCDTFGRSVRVLGEDGTEHQAAVNQFSALEAGTPFPIREGMQSEPFPPGGRVTVTRIDPVLNQWRTRGVGPMEAGAYVGQTGILEFAFYPVNGVRMYRVLFERGARRDFSDAELALVPSAQA